MWWVWRALGRRGWARWIGGSEGRRDVAANWRFLQASELDSGLHLTAHVPSPSLSTTTSHRNARLVTLFPVSLSVDRVELLRSIGFAGTGGGRGDVDLLFGAAYLCGEARVGPLVGSIAPRCQKKRARSPRPGRRVAEKGRETQGLRWQLDDNDASECVDRWQRDRERRWMSNEGDMYRLGPRSDGMERGLK